MRSSGEDGSAYSVETARLRFRARRDSDIPGLNALASNPAIAPNLCATVPAGSGERLVIVERASGRIIGAAVYGSTGLGSGVEIGLWIGEPGWFQGLGTEAAHALIDRAFADENVAVVWCTNRVTNTRARRVIEKCGFQFRGNGLVRLAGRGAVAVERFALERRCWLSLKAWGAAPVPLRTSTAAEAPTAA